MPHKGQLAVLAVSRFVDFFQMASLQTYMVHQLKSFDPTLPDSAISHQAGVLQGSFTAAQIVTAVVWGRVADMPWSGRKRVLLIGLVGTAFSCLGVGFAHSFLSAAVWRMLGGAINGTIGSARTMVAETVDKRWHSRAFLLLPLAFNVANILGPILSGLLVEPVVSYPKLFGENSVFGGADGVGWMETYPYALPNLLCAVLLIAEAALVYFFSRETLASIRNASSPPPGPIDTFKKWISTFQNKGRGYALVDNSQQMGLLSMREGEAMEMSSPVTPSYHMEKPVQSKKQQVLPFNRIWTANVLWVLLSIAIFDFHMGAFSSLWIVFLSTDRPAVEATQKLAKRGANPFLFSGGLAFEPAAIGFALAVLGIVGLFLQLSIYPWANGRFGLMRCFRYSLFLFPLAYFLAPYLSLLPSPSAAPSPASGFWVWLGISMILTLQVSARTFALPASIILLNNSSPHPSVLATIHGIGQSVSSTFRTVGPIAAGYWYGVGLEKGMVGMAWWVVAAVSAIGCVASFWVRNGTGHEILLPGEEDPESTQR
ncbi:MFS general substrate transporter [Saccharata proteae CBS 121410]|uniref:MFS general substrate transporter n=1 Tax=Saccharata proteae CBS 121410 TaxID=1314787 RepID=A0A9P4HUM4_9PEZI|nr:MFS general substrate transporter [Saccharata proteae CBS 121410]